MREPFGQIRLEALPAADVWHARAALTLYAVAPRSTVAVALNASGLRPGDIAGFALFHRSYAWLGVERTPDGLSVVGFDEQSGTATRLPLPGGRVRLRADCDFVARSVVFLYGTDDGGHAVIGEPHALAVGPRTTSVRCSLFCCATGTQGKGGHADLDSFVVTTEGGDSASPA